MYQIRHFRPEEFECRCCNERKIASGLIFWLEVLRRAANGAIVVNSGYRCTKRNHDVGGAPNSRHVIGCAADLRTPRNMTYEAFASLARRLAGDGFEVKTYPERTYIHFAVPRNEAGKDWTGGNVKL